MPSPPVSYGLPVLGASESGRRGPLRVGPGVGGGTSACTCSCWAQTPHRGRSGCPGPSLPLFTPATAKMGRSVFRRTGPKERMAVSAVLTAIPVDDEVTDRKRSFLEGRGTQRRLAQTLQGGQENSQSTAMSGRGPSPSQYYHNTADYTPRSRIFTSPDLARYP